MSDNETVNLSQFPHVELTNLQVDEIIEGLIVPNAAAIHALAVEVRDARAAKKAAEQQ